MKTLSRILAFLKAVIDAWNASFSGDKARENQEKQRAKAEQDNEEARADAAQKAKRERERKLEDLQGEDKW